MPPDLSTHSRKLIIYAATSLDGFIATEDGGVDWLERPEFNIEGEDYGYNAFYGSIDATVMGNNTYRKILDFDVPFPYHGKKNYVFTRQSGVPPTEFVEFISDDIPDFVATLKKQPGRNIWLVGGGEINTLLLSNRLVDKIMLSVAPVILGAGIKLFPRLSDETVLDLEHSETYGNGFVQMEYSVRSS